MSAETCTISTEPPIQAVPLPQVYYQPAGKHYWREDSNRRWMAVDKDSAKNMAILAGFSSRPQVRGCLAAADECLLRIQAEQNIAYAAPLAGYSSGFYTINEERVLVTQSPKLITPVAGEWPVLGKLLEGMFVDGDNDQRPYLYGWLKQGIAAVRTHNWMAGQVVAFAGPPRAGKSLLQGIITDLLGGRSAQPYQFMTGGTPFNADLFRAEHLIVDDQAESTSINARKAFGGNIKRVAVTPNHRCHPKNQTPLTLTPIWRMTISLNDEPERMLVLPPLNEDIADKLMIFKVIQRPMPMPTSTAEEQQAFITALQRELPAFAHFLENYEIPGQLTESRFGIATYQHPDLVQQLAETAPEIRLLELMDQLEIFVRDKSIEATAMQWMETLTTPEMYGHQARQLLPHVNACANYLCRLEKLPDSRVTSRILDGRRLYTVTPPVNRQTSGQVDHFSMSNVKNDDNRAVVREQSGESSPLLHLSSRPSSIPSPPAGLLLK